MDEVYPAKKSRFGKLSGKGNVKVCNLLTYVRLFLLVFLVLHFFFNIYLVSLSKFIIHCFYVKLLGNVQESVSMEQPNSLKNLSVLSNLAARKRDQLSWYEI